MKLSTRVTGCCRVQQKMGTAEDGEVRGTVGSLMLCGQQGRCWGWAEVRPSSVLPADQSEW